MEEITLGEIAKALAFFLGLGGSVTAIIIGLKKIITKLLEPLILDSCKDFIVQILSEAERGTTLTEMEKLRLAERFQTYTDRHGNSYIKEWHTRLKAEGKI